MALSEQIASLNRKFDTYEHKLGYKKKSGQKQHHFKKKRKGARTVLGKRTEHAAPLSSGVSVVMQAGDKGRRNTNSQLVGWRRQANRGAELAADRVAGRGAKIAVTRARKFEQLSVFDRPKHHDAGEQYWTTTELRNHWDKLDGRTAQNKLVRVRSTIPCPVPHRGPRHTVVGGGAHEVFESGMPSVMRSVPLPGRPERQIDVSIPPGRDVSIPPGRSGVHCTTPVPRQYRPPRHAVPPPVRALNENHVESVNELKEAARREVSLVLAASTFLCT